MTFDGELCSPWCCSRTAGGISGLGSPAQSPPGSLLSQSDGRPDFKNTETYRVSKRHLFLSLSSQSNHFFTQCFQKVAASHFISGITSSRKSWVFCSNVVIFNFSRMFNFLKIHSDVLFFSQQMLKLLARTLKSRGESRGGFQTLTHLAFII